MVPVIAGMVGVAALGALAQAYQAEKARKANEKRLKEIEEAFDRLKPPEFDVSIMDPPNYIKNLPPPPNIDTSAIKPKDFEIVGKYVPEVATYVAESRPELVKQTEVGQEADTARINALRKLMQVSETGRDPILETQAARAEERAQAEAQSRQASILQDAARRGMAGAGTTLAAQLQGSSDAMSNLAESERDLAAQSYARQLQAMREGSALAGDISADELSLAGRNVDTINSYNQRMSKAHQDYLKYASDMRNRGNLRNLDVEQEIANRNVAQGNEAEWKNRAMANTGAQQTYENRMGQVDRLNKIASDESQFRVGQRENANKYTQTNFGNILDITRGRTGVDTQRMGQATQNAQDRIAAIGGVTGAIGSGLGQYGNYSQAKETNRANTNIKKYEATGDKKYLDEDYEEDY